jgi:hypothetical protein
MCWTKGVLGIEEGDLTEVGCPEYAVEERSLAVTVVGLNFDIVM